MSSSHPLDRPTNGKAHGGAEHRHAGATMDALRRIVRALRTTHPSARGFLNLSAAQLFVLQQIAAAPGMSLVELCQRTLTSPSSASEVVARLVLAGFVARRTSASDQRRAAFTLTTEGEDAVAGAPASAQERLLLGFAALAPDDQRNLAELLGAWTTAAGMGALPASMFLEPLADDGGMTDGERGLL